MSLLEPPPGPQVYRKHKDPIHDFYLADNFLQRKQLLIPVIEKFRFTLDILAVHDCLTRTKCVQAPAPVLAFKH
jgi:hypothetical protein